MPVVLAAAGGVVVVVHDDGGAVGAALLPLEEAVFLLLLLHDDLRRCGLVRGEVLGGHGLHVGPVASPLALRARMGAGLLDLRARGGRRS